MSTIGEINRHIIKLIGESATPTILGLLPVETGMQEECIKEVKDYIAGSYRRLRLNFGYFPAASAYAVAVSIGRGVTEANFYNALRDQLGLELSAAERSDLAALFSRVCSDLGLVMPPAEDEDHADRNLRQIIFQAAILPYWVTHLAQAVMAYLEKMPCPDLEEDEQVAKFATLLVGKVPYAQRRLCRTLTSSVGPLVCNAILRAFSTGDFDRLPPHLRVPMREAREKTGADSVKSPFLRYRPESGELAVVLPRQSSRLVDYNSQWILEGCPPFNALIERELEAGELGVGPVLVGLINLRNQLQDQSFLLKLQPDAKEPFFLFRASDGRRLAAGERSDIELGLGDYYLLLGDGVSTNEEESFETVGKYRRALIEMFPNRAVLKVQTAERVVSIRPRLAADILVQDPAGNRICTTDGTPIYYGETLEVHAFCPGDGHSEPDLLEFKIECVENSSVPAKIWRPGKPSQRGAYDFYDLTAGLLRPFLAELPAGIFSIQISAEGKARSFHRRLLYWKGFRGTSPVFGFQCSTPPQNFDPATSVGLLSNAQGLKLDPNHLGAEVILGVRQPARVYSLPKPGLWLHLVDADQYGTRPLVLGQTVEVNPSARQSLVIESGDVLAWQITCRGTVLATLKPGQSKHTLSLSGLLGQFGDVGRLEAIHPGGVPTEALLFAKANLIRDLAVENQAGSVTYRASFRLSQSQVGVIEVKLTNFADGSDAGCRQELVLAAGEFPAVGLGESGATWRIVAEGSDWLVVLEVQLTKIPAGIHFLDFRGRKQADDAWQPLKVADKFGLSESRLVLVGPALADATDNWTRMITSVCGAFHKGSPLNLAWLTLTNADLAQTLHRLQEALLFKYASAVWPGVKWLENALMGVCQACCPPQPGEAQGIFARAAVTGLEVRSEGALNIHSILIFGSQSKIMSVPGQAFSTEEPPRKQIGKVFHELGKIGAAPDFRSYAAAAAQLDCYVFAGFSNFAAVAKGQAKEFKDFDFTGYFKRLSDDAQQLDSNQARCPVDHLLSAAHFLTAIRALNRRLRMRATTMTRSAH